MLTAHRATPWTPRPARMSGATPHKRLLKECRFRFRLVSASLLAITDQLARVFVRPCTGRITAQSSRSMYSVSRHRLLRRIQFVAPGGNLFRRSDHKFDKQAREQLSMEPCAATFQVFLGQVSKSHNRLHSFKGQFDLPPGSIQVKSGLAAPGRRRQRGPQEEILGGLQRLRGYRLLLPDGLPL